MLFYYNAFFLLVHIERKGVEVVNCVCMLAGRESYTFRERKTPYNVFKERRGGDVVLCV